MLQGSKPIPCTAIGFRSLLLSFPQYTETVPFMQLKDTANQRPPESRWPNCPDIADLCPIYKMAKTLGVDVQDILISFIGSAGDGSRMTLQKNQTGFTIQVTGPVKRTSEEAADLDQDGLNTRGKKLG